MLRHMSTYRYGRSDELHISLDHPGPELMIRFLERQQIKALDHVESEIAQERALLGIEMSTFHTFVENAEQQTLFLFKHLLVNMSRLSEIELHQRFDRIRRRSGVGLRKLAGEESAEFVGRSHIGDADLTQFAHHLVALVLDHRTVDLLLILKIGVDSAPPLVGRISDIADGGVLDALTEEELTCHLDEFFASLECHSLGMIEQRDID